VRIALASLAAALGVGLHVHLPRDHFPHPGAGIEWWYVTGLVRGADGHRYSVFATLFRRSGYVLPISQVIDLDTGRRVGHSERVARAELGPGSLDVSAGGAGLRYDGAANTWHFSASAPAGYGLELTAKPEKPYALHGGGTGVIRQSVVGPSAYYSATRMSARGTILSGGRRVAFTGTAWLDHQWGDFENDPRAFAWDWFSCRFDDRTELMLYRFRATGEGNGTYVARDGSARAVRGFSVAPGERVFAAAGHRWPLDWLVRVPALGLRVSVRSLARDQLFHGVIVPTFWEGASAATGTKRGYCFVEETRAGP